MSKAISRFERAHHVRLLHRTTHAIALTEEGDRLLEEGRTLLETLERAERSLAGLHTHGGTGRVRITAPTSFARTCIMPALPAFLRAHPEIHLEVQFGNEITDLAAAGIDLAIRSGRLEGLPGHVSRQLFNFPWVACAAPDYLARLGTPGTPADLGKHEHIGFRNKATGQIINWRFANPADRNNVRFMPRTQHVFDDAEAAWSLVGAGFGIAWAPAWLGLEDLRQGRVVEVLKDWRIEQTPLSMVRLDSRHTPKRTSAVMDFVASLPATWRL